MDQDGASQGQPKRTGSPAQPPVEAPGATAAGPDPAASGRPLRYLLRESGEGRVLTCREAPRIEVVVERGLVVPAAQMSQEGPGAIFLDGAGEGGPLLDTERQVYNLDHHEGCVRAFTLATCEQALVLVRKGLDLRGREWTVYANEPDLDTVLAIWVLLNFMRINGDNPEVRRAITPLVRLEGNIDVHGLELKELCGFPEEELAAAFEQLERLRRREVAVKESGRWGEMDVLEYTADLLRAIDELVYTAEEFAGDAEVEELARTELPGGSLAVVCRADSQIYAVEGYLRRLFGERLGIIALQKDPATYTLRQVNPFQPASLERAYEHLNQIDRAAGHRGSGNRWGGSAEIGGSPRKTGTRLTPEELAGALAQAYRRPSWVTRFRGWAWAVATPAGVLALAWLALSGWRRLAPRPEPAAGEETAVFASALALLSLGAWLLAGRRRPGLYGLRRPARLDGLLPLVVAVPAALAGGAWGAAPWSLDPAHLPLPLVIAGTLLLPAAAELLFRGVAHGRLVAEGGLATSHGWLPSAAVVAAAALYTAGSPGIFLAHSTLGELTTAAWHLPVRLAAAFALGLATGVARERSESLLPPLLLHWLAAAAAGLAAGAVWG